MDRMLTPAGDAGVREAMLPLMLSTQMRLPPHLAELSDDERNRAEKAFYSQQSAEYCRLLGHIPLDILKAAADASVLESPFFPFPADLMKHAGPEFDRRKRESERIDRMIAIGGRTQQAKAQTFQPEPEEHRLRAAIWRGWDARINGKGFLTARLWWSGQEAERRLAQLEQREPENWALDVGPEQQDMVEKADGPGLPPPSPESQARLKLALAKRWREQGNDERADSLEAEAHRLAPALFEPAEEPVAA